MIMRKHSKAQTGMEYLMTYGWAVLVIGIIILLLLSLKVFDIDWYSVSNEVKMTSSFAIPDFKAIPYEPSPGTHSIIIFQLINNIGTNISVLDIKIRDPDGNDVQIGSYDGSDHIYVYYCPSTSSCQLNATAFPFNMTPGQRMIINATMKIPGELNTVFTTKIEIKSMTTYSTSVHTDTGMIRGRVEPPE